MATLFRRGRDFLGNGVIFGLVASSFLIWGNKIYSWLLINVPAYWTETIPLWVSVLIIGGIVGYVIDRV